MAFFFCFFFRACYLHISSDSSLEVEGGRFHSLLSVTLPITPLTSRCFSFPFHSYRPHVLRWNALPRQALPRPFPRVLRCTKHGRQTGGRCTVFFLPGFGPHFSPTSTDRAGDKCGKEVKGRGVCFPPRRVAQCRAASLQVTNGF